MRRNAAIPWDTAILVKPEIPEPSASSGETPADALPDLWPEISEEPPNLSAERSVPPRPRVITPVIPAADADKPAAPTIAPQLTREEGALAEFKMNESLAIAEKNLEAASRKQLNSMQLDLVSKIKEFVKDAREAAQSGDWAGARSLAKKAEVLSQELAAPR